MLNFLKYEIIFPEKYGNLLSRPTSHEAELYNLHLEMHVLCEHCCAIRPIYSLVVIFVHEDFDVALQEREESYIMR